MIELTFAEVGEDKELVSRMFKRLFVSWLLAKLSSDI